MKMGSPEELRGWCAEIELAADRLDERVKAAADDLDHDEYWMPYEKLTAWQDGFVNGFGGKCSELAGVLTPGIMTEIVRMMRAEVRAASWRHAVSPHLLAFARGVNVQVEAGKKRR